MSEIASNYSSDCEGDIADNALLYFCGISAVSAPQQALTAGHIYIRDHSGNTVITNKAVCALCDNYQTLPFISSVQEFLSASFKGNPSSVVPIDAFLELPSRTEKWLRPYDSRLPDIAMRAIRFVISVHYIQSQWKMHCRNCQSCACFGADIFTLFKDFEIGDINEILEDFPFAERFCVSDQPDFHFVLDTFEIIPPQDTVHAKQNTSSLQISAAPFVPSFAPKKSQNDEFVDDLTRTLLQGTEGEETKCAFSLFDGASGIVKDGIQFPGKPGDIKITPPPHKNGEMSHIQKLIDQQNQTGVPAAPREWVQAVVDQALMQAQSAIFAGIRARQGELVGALVNKKDKPAKSTGDKSEENSDAEYMPIPWSWCPWLPKESLYRVKMCSYFYHTGHCNKGESCNFSHEMLPGMPPPKPPSSVRHGLNSKKSGTASPKMSTKVPPIKEEPNFSVFEDKYPNSIFSTDN